MKPLPHFLDQFTTSTVPHFRIFYDQNKQSNGTDQWSSHLRDLNITEVSQQLRKRMLW